MMAVICFCLRPLVLSEREERTHKQSAAIRQLGSYIWVLPPENPQGLAHSTFASHILAREKWAEQREPGGKPEAGCCRKGWLLSGSALNIEAPKIRERLLHLQADLPACRAFMSAPNRNRFARTLVQQIYQTHPFSHRESFGQDGHASIATDISGVTLRTNRLAGVGPFDCHGHARIEAPGATDVLCPLLKFHVLRWGHVLFLLFWVYEQLSTWFLWSRRIAKQRSWPRSSTISTGYECSRAASMELQNRWLRVVNVGLRTPGKCRSENLLPRALPHTLASLGLRP